MDAFILANMLFQGTAAIALILMSASSAASELHDQVAVRSWSATGEVPSVLELLEGPHADVTPMTAAKVEGPAEAVRYG